MRESEQTILSGDTTCFKIMKGQIQLYIIMMHPGGQGEQKIKFHVTEKNDIFYNKEQLHVLYLSIFPMARFKLYQCN